MLRWVGGGSSERRIGAGALALGPAAALRYSHKFIVPVFAKIWLPGVH